MCDKNLTNAEKWKIHQAKVLLESLCVDIEHSVNLEVEGVNLIVSRDNSVMECNKCGEKMGSRNNYAQERTFKITSIYPKRNGICLFL